MRGSKEGAILNIFNHTKTMKKSIYLAILALLLTVFFCSCSKYTSIERAANGKAKCGQGLR
jgi:hypothetical protein